MLTGKYSPGDVPRRGTRATDPSGSRFMSELLTDDVLAAVQRLGPIAADAGLSQAQLAVAWTLQEPGTCPPPVVGATRPERVRENVKAAGVRLDADIMARIDEALGGVVVRDPLTSSPRVRS